MITPWPRSLLWRTVLLIAALLIAAQLTALLLVRLSDRGPRAQEGAQQVASIVQLARAALTSTAPDKRRELLAQLTAREGIRIYAEGEGDPPEIASQASWLPLLQDELHRSLGPATRYRFVPSHGGNLWVSFSVKGDHFWAVVPSRQLEHPFPLRWLGWVTAVLAFAMFGAYALVSRINGPLRALAGAAVRLGRGEAVDRLHEDGPAEIRALTRAFNQMATDLAHLDADRTLMLAGVSHDLRTPLSRLRVELEMLPPDTPGRAAMIQDIEDMDAVLGQFLAYAQGSTAEREKTVELNALAQAATERYERMDKRIMLDLGQVPPLPLRQTAITRAITNLLDNAFKYGQRPEQSVAEVTLRTARERDQVRVSVLDRGPGIPESELARLKKPFTRLDSSRSNAAGSGLGLAIVDRIARQHGGRLWLRARAGGGLDATVELPVQKASV